MTAMAEKRIIAVAMSGGVDSSVSAALLREQGHDVFGIMLRLWSPEGVRNRCCAPEDMATARRVASQLDIPFYALDAQALFKHEVVDYFVDGYRKGVTPNPCLACNRHVRFRYMLDQALALGATHLATGHYARLIFEQGRYKLLRGIDTNKDQSYVLSILSQAQLAQTMFPLGGLTKTEVRQHARRLRLSVAERPDSQDLCFVGQQDYRSFLQARNIPLPPPGPIVNSYGQHLGQHDGLAFYTIGQRKGLGISNTAPLYVIHKDLEHNTLIVGPREELGRKSFDVAAVNWVAGEAPNLPMRAQVQIRYKAPIVWASVQSMAGDHCRVILDSALPDITPGQAAVFYHDELCLGGGIIQL